MKVNKPQYYLVPAAVCLLTIFGLSYYYFLTDFSAKKEVAYIYIDDDDTADSVYAKLSPIASEHSMTGFRTLARYAQYESHLHTGRYAIQPGEGPVKVLRQLRNGTQAPVRLTIPESRTMDRLAGALSHKLMLDSLTLANAFQDSAFCARYGYDTATIASLFIPNTYDLYWNVSLDNLMSRMEKENRVFWNAGRLQKAQQIGMNQNQVCTLASIIDEETANNGEKPMIAGMYYNRIKAGMPLQADPTIKFALKKFELRRIYKNLLQVESPYNTYKNAGLPPGPIKIASIAGIDAVLNHVDHDYLYMCAKEDFSGTHNFARTYAEHLKNAAKYSRALNERGIK